MLSILLYSILMAETLFPPVFSPEIPIVEAQGIYNAYLQLTYNGNLRDYTEILRDLDSVQTNLDQSIRALIGKVSSPSATTYWIHVSRDGNRTIFELKKISNGENETAQSFDSWDALAEYVKAL